MEEAKDTVSLNPSLTFHVKAVRLSDNREYMLHTHPNKKDPLINLIVADPEFRSSLVRRWTITKKLVDKSERDLLGCFLEMK